MVYNINYCMTKYTNLLLIITLTLLSTLILYVPFALHASSWLGIKIENPGFNSVYQHFDGPLYVVAAKTMYAPKAIVDLHLELPLQPIYFAAHLPGYPLFIAFFAPLFGFLKSMLFVNILASVALACFFYYFVKHFKLSEQPLLLTTVFLFLPRFLVVRSVGAPESLFLLFILVSIFFFEKKNYLLAGLAGGIAITIKSPAGLLFIAYGFVLLERLIKTKKFEWQWLFLGLIPLGLLAVFGLYARQYGDFFAYFNSGDNLHLVFPYSAFNFQKDWVATAWLEDIIFYFFLYGYAILTLKNTAHRSLFYFALVFFTATIFVQHRDIARYSLPIWPLACIALEKFFTSKKFLLIFIILLPAIYFYAWDFMFYNLLPISDWKAYL